MEYYRVMKGDTRSLDSSSTSEFAALSESKTGDTRSLDYSAYGLPRLGITFFVSLFTAC